MKEKTNIPQRKLIKSWFFEKVKEASKFQDCNLPSPKRLIQKFLHWYGYICLHVYIYEFLNVGFPLNNSDENLFSMAFWAPVETREVKSTWHDCWYSHAKLPL